MEEKKEIKNSAILRKDLLIIESYDANGNAYVRDRIMVIHVNQISRVTREGDDCICVHIGDDFFTLNMSLENYLHAFSIFDYVG